jgi:hypothetical protein
MTGALFPRCRNRSARLTQRVRAVTRSTHKSLSNAGGMLAFARGMRRVGGYEWACISLPSERELRKAFRRRVDTSPKTGGES